MNSIEKITNVTKNQVAEAFAAQSQRIKKASNNISERFFRRHSDGANVTDDMAPVPCPAAPEMPKALLAVIDPNTYGLRYVTPSCGANELCMHGLTRTYSGREYFDLIDATPADYLAGFRAITDLAERYESLAREYKASVIAATEAHIKAQLDSARDLAAAILAVEKKTPSAE